MESGPGAGTGAGLRAACVIGWPVAHSRSPLVHNYWLKQYGIAGEYRREAVPPAEFAPFVGSLATRGYIGANVTLPHKEAVLAVSTPDDGARAIGAANTLWLDGGTVRSTNTDVEGFLANLDASAPRWDRGSGKAVVLGAGGGARAVVQGLVARGMQRVVVVNRSADRSAALRETFGTRVDAVSWDERDTALADAALLVNTTSLGMQGQPDLAVDLAGLPRHAVVADLVYAPVRTKLLAAAEAAGLAIADGLGMLLHQAVRGFSLWFGTTPAVTAELRGLVEADLAAKR